MSKYPDALCKQGRDNRPAPSRECSATAERLVRAFDELRCELVSKLCCALGNYQEAEDAAQEAFLKCWRNREGIDKVANLRAWIFRIGFNAAKDSLRSAWKRHARPLVDPSIFVDAPAACPLKSAEEEEAREHLQRAIANLQPKEREVFLLRYSSDLTYEEIAKLRCSPVGTVKTQMRTAAAKLRRVLRQNASENLSR